MEAGTKVVQISSGSPTSVAVLTSEELNTLLDTDDIPLCSLVILERLVDWKFLAICKIVFS